jgi:hypothetical protein
MRLLAELLNANEESRGIFGLASRRICIPTHLTEDAFFELPPPRVRALRLQAPCHRDY